MSKKIVDARSLSIFVLLFGAVSPLLSLTTQKFYNAQSEENIFDPNDCYEPGTIFEENEKNLGFCPCKFGYFGPQCFDIYDCVIGNLRTDNCSREYNGDYDLQWRCAASKREIIKICTCPEGFRGETCEFILENSVFVWWKTVKQSQHFFEAIYPRSRSFARAVGEQLWRIIREYRRLIMFVLFVAILELTWRHTRKQKRCVQKTSQVLPSAEEGGVRSGGTYMRLNRQDEEAAYWSLQEEPLPEKLKPECLKFELISETPSEAESHAAENAETVENAENLKNETTLHKPSLHI